MSPMSSLQSELYSTVIMWSAGTTSDSGRKICRQYPDSSSCPTIFQNEDWTEFRALSCYAERVLQALALKQFYSIQKLRWTPHHLFIDYTARLNCRISVLFLDGACFLQSQLWYFPTYLVFAWSKFLISCIITSAATYHNRRNFIVGLENVFSS